MVDETPRVPGTVHLPKDGMILARVNYPIKPERMEKWSTAKRWFLQVTVWNVTADGQTYGLVVNGDHRLMTAIMRGERPRYVQPAPEFKAAFWSRSDEDKLGIVRTWGSRSPEWINVETGERIDALSAPLEGAPDAS